MFTYPYGTFTYRTMPFGLCNALVTFQNCMVSIIFDMVECLLKIFIDYFSILEIHSKSVYTISS